MTDSYIRRSLKRIKVNTEGLHQKVTPILLADSKGHYINNEIVDTSQLNIQFINHSSTRLRDSIDFVDKNLYKRTKRFKNTHVYVWIGNCDITRKDGRYLTLRFSNADTLAAYMKDKLEKLVVAIQNTRKKHKPAVTLLEIPNYSISEFNKSRGHPNPQIYYEEDLRLSKQIEKVNNTIRQINSGNLRHSPKFSLDLTRPTKGRKCQYAKARSHYNFKHVYIDGEHPNPLLAKLWYQRIGRQIVNDCFSSKKPKREDARFKKKHAHKRKK